MSSRPAALERPALRAGQVALAWLGQSGFVLHGPGRTVLVDAFLSPHPDRLAAPAFDPGQAAGVDLIACTHEHWDHLDLASLPALLAASPAARVLVPEPVVPLVAGLGVEAARVIPARPGEPVEQENVVVHPVPARHGVHPADAYTFGEELSGGQVRYLGYVFDLGGVHVYHAGDTIRYQGQAELLRNLGVDLALLPINGRDAEREARDVVGNLGPEEAVELAAEVSADLLVPMHHDMFAANPGFPEQVVAGARQRHPELAVLVPGRGRMFVYTRART